MKNLKRIEHRYFCESTLSDSIEKLLDSMETLTRINYSCPVTETVYFTRGSKVNYTMPEGLTVRLRKYTTCLSEVIKITSDRVVLEVKLIGRTGYNTKERISISGIDAINSLTRKRNNIFLSQLKDTYTGTLVPTGATQSYRCHWIHTNGLRLTLDKNIRVFLFKKSLYQAQKATTLNEGKLEFKFPKANGDNKILEQEIVTLCDCKKNNPNYLERRLRECLKIKMF